MRLVRHLHLQYALPTVEKVANTAHIALKDWPSTVPWEKTASLGTFLVKENGITRLRTPPELVDDWRQNTIVAVCMARKNNVGLAWADTVEGKTFYTTTTRDQLPDELARLRAAQIVYEGPASEKLGVRATFPRSFAGLDNVELGIRLASNDMSPIEMAATSGLFGFLKDASNQKFQVPVPAPSDRLELDTRAVVALELLTASSSLKGSLLSQIRRTKTPSGTRYLERLLLAPYKDQVAIERQLDAVQRLQPHKILELQQALGGFIDGKKLLKRLAQAVSPLDVYQWAESVEFLEQLAAHLEPADASSIEAVLAKVQPLAKEIIANITTLDTPEVGEYVPIFKPTYEPLRPLYAKRDDFEHICAQVLAEFTSYKAKIRYNTTYGYHIIINGQPKFGEVAERVGKTSVFKHALLDQAGHAQSGFDARLREQEQALLKQLRDKALGFNLEMRAAFELVDRVDVTQSFATLAMERRLVRPQFGACLEVKDGRHLGVEQWSLEQGHNFVPNTISLDGVLMLTGPNMGGKSTLLRQVAQTIILAQMGCFVPASSAQLPIFDKILCRMGSGDDGWMGQSTFMVEMLETAAILQRATPNSLALMDEVGRGTSRKDGVAIAFASISSLECRALFATHFGPSINTLCKQHGVQIDAYQCVGHKFEPGICADSMGISLAKRAGFPEAALQDAKRYLDANNK